MKFRLLTRFEEITLAKRIEETRREFRTKLLECDYVIRQSLSRRWFAFIAASFPFDRTVQVSVTDRLEKEQILGRIPHNLEYAWRHCFKSQSPRFSNRFFEKPKQDPSRSGLERFGSAAGVAARCVLIEELGTTNTPH